MTDNDFIKQLQGSLGDEEWTEEKRQEFQKQLSLSKQSTDATMMRHQSIDMLSHSSKASYMTAITSKISYFEPATPTKFYKAGGLESKPEAATEVPLLLNAFVDEPRTFLDIDDEERVRRSKERAIAKQKELEKMMSQTRVEVDPARIQQSIASQQHKRRETNHTIIESLESGNDSQYIDIETMDAGTQVFSMPRQNHRHRLLQLRRERLLVTEICKFEGCSQRANGGLCEFSICFVRGCDRDFCARHAAKSANPEEDMLAGKVCSDCEKRANRAFYLTIGLIFFVALLIALPGILIYGGDNSTVPPSLEGLQ